MTDNTTGLYKPMLRGLKLTPENFKKPPMEMGILPFWFWNGELDEREMEWQMKEYLDKGVTGVFLHGRFGLKVPYLSEEWFEKTKFVVAKGRELGLDIWVYDEMNWPSGTAERQVPQQYPHLTQKYLEMVVLDVAGPLFTYLEASDSRYVNTGNSKPIAAYVCSAEEWENGIENIIDLTPNLSFEKVIPWEAPPGQWKLMYFLEKEADYYIDALNPESTQRFLELTHDQYKKAVGEEFGKIVPGFYTDEPAMHYYHVGQDNYVIPWSNRMFKIFRDRRGYDIKPFLPALYSNMGSRTQKIRYDFWNTLSEQYSEAYYQQIRDWCDENDVIFTGHLLFEEWLRAHARCEGNIFNHLKKMHLIGVDHLYPKVGTEREPDQHVALKIASSAAHHFGSERLLCESMGGTYWDCTLERMKWMANWEYVLGVNLFNNHGYHYSIEGERKRDWPPSQFYHHTWWKYYNYFTEYMARLGHILSGGKHVAKILILYPLNSIWTNYVPQKRNAIGDVIEYDVYYLTDTLLRLHYDFDFIDEDVLIDAVVSNGQLKVAEENYDLAILPPLTHIKRGSLVKLSEFVTSGGSLIGDTLLPVEFLDDGSDATNEVKELFGIDSARILEEFENDPKFEIVSSGGGKLNFFKGPGLHVVKNSSHLKSVLDKCIEPDVIISEGDVFYLHRIKNGWDIYFLVNTSQEAKGQVTISLEKTGQPELWDPNTGDITPIHVFEILGDRLVFELDFPPSESRIVVVRNPVPDKYITASDLEIESFDGEQIDAYGAPDNDKIKIDLNNNGKTTSLELERKVILKPLALCNTFTIFTDNPNVLILDSWKMKLVEEGANDAEYSEHRHDDSDWLDVTMGAWEMQLPQERLEPTYPATVWYRAEFQIDEIPAELKLLIDGFSGSEHKLFINGNPVKDPGQRSYLDAEIKEVLISEFMKKGINTIAVCLVVNKRTEGLLDLLKITGNFSLSENKAIITAPAELKTGDWTRQGYPYFSGTISYTTSIDLPNGYLEGKLFLEADCGEDVLEIELNGNHAGLLPWRPHLLDITEYLNEGTNQITLKVTNTLLNMLEKKSIASGLFWEPRIVFYPRYQIKIA